MKGAFLVAINLHLEAEVRAALQKMGAKFSDEGDVCQLRDDRGRLFTVFVTLESEISWDWQDEPIIMKVGEKPNMLATTACWIECRWEDLFVRLVETIAAELTTTAWVLDSDGVLWPALQIDQGELLL